VPTEVPLLTERGVTYEGKRKVYEGLVLAILLYSSGCWCLRESEVQELRSFHHDCVRTMCRISMWHVGRYSITNRELLGRLGLQTMGTYIPCAAAAAVSGACVADGMVAAAKEAAHSVGAGGGEVGGRA
jgi:hypothetical protein